MDTKEAVPTPGTAQEHETQNIFGRSESILIRPSSAHDVELERVFPSINRALDLLDDLLHFSLGLIKTTALEVIPNKPINLLEANVTFKWLDRHRAI
jgi:hypothetical protein